MTQGQSRVAMLLAPGQIALQEREIPVPEPGGIVVRVRVALTDGTDLKTYRRGHPKMPMPTPFGHEFSGDVVAVGDGVTAFAPGQAVMCANSAPCARCFWCERGEEELCESLMATKLLGAYADHVAVPPHIVARNCFTKPADLGYREAAFLEPLACVVHSVEFLRASGLRDVGGTVVAVIGDGAFGILHALLLREEGVRAILIGRRAERLARARAYEIETLDARDTDVAAAVASATQGRGVDAAIECTGRAEVWESVPALVRRGGVASFFGGLPSDARVSFSAARLHYDEVRLVSPFHLTPIAVRRAYELLATRAFDLRPLIDPVVPLTEIAALFARLDAGQGMKAAIEP